MRVRGVSLATAIGVVAAVGIVVVMALSFRSTSSSAGSATTSVFVWNGSTTAPPASAGSPSFTSSVAPTIASTVATTSNAPSTAPTDVSESTANQPDVTNVDRAMVRVRVVNAGGRAGAAQAASDALRAAGYQPLEPADGRRVPTAAVLFAPGHRAEALAVAASLYIPAERVRPADPGDPNWTEFGEATLDVLVMASVG